MQNYNKLKKGVIYIAFGYEYLLMAIHSAETVKKTNPDVLCELITNLPFNNSKFKDYSPFDSTKFFKCESKYNRKFKTNIIDYATFDIGAYLDCDIEIKGSLEPIFRCLDRFDVAIKMEQEPQVKDFLIAPGIHGHFFPVWNGGVIFFRKNEIAKTLFKKWFEIYRKEQKTSDQPALVRAIYETPDLKLLSLNAIWNTFSRKEVLILNYRKLSKSSIEWLKESRIWHYRRPEEWPYVAPSLYNIHKNISNFVVRPDTITSKEIYDIGRKYKIFSTAFYRFIFNRPLFKRGFEIILKILIKLGIVKDIKLYRNRYYVGEKYKRKKITDF
jgi:hypothetical protein